MKLSEARERGLRILKDHGPLMPKRFAEHMWPDAEAWDHRVKCGPYGSHKGGGMYLAAGGFLGKLAKDGYAHPVFERSLRRYKITPAGLKALEEG